MAESYHDDYDGEPRPDENAQLKQRIADLEKRAELAESLFMGDPEKCESVLVVNILRTWESERIRRFAEHLSSERIADLEQRLAQAMEALEAMVDNYLEVAVSSYSRGDNPLNMADVEREDPEGYAALLKAEEALASLKGQGKAGGK